MSAAKMSRRERFLAAGCLVVSALAIATAETRAWAAYPSLVFPSFGPATLIGALLLLPLPAMLNAPTLLEPARENA